MNSQTPNGTVSSSNAKPYVVQCNPGYHWDYYWKKCMPDCPTGYHNDSITGACVVNQPPASTNLALMDSAGAYHNEYQEYMLNLIVKSTISLSDTVSLKTFILTNSKSFFQSKGIATTGLNINFAPSGDTVVIFQPNNYSMAGSSLMSQLQSLLNKYTPNNDPTFFTTLNSLKSQALSLPGNEQLTVGIPICVAISSYSYWNSNLNRWDSLLAIHQNNTLIMKATTGGIGLGSLGAADVSGAIAGAYAGVELGPGGALAGGVLVSATYSLGNLAGQVMHHFFSWW